MQGILIYRGPKGYESMVDISHEEAQTLSTERALKDYPDLKLHDAWLLQSWHLMPDDGGVFFQPKPWPVASFYNLDHAKQLNEGEVPRWLVLVASSPATYTHHFLPNKEEVRSWLEEIMGSHGCVVADNEVGGLTVTWPTQGEPLVVGYAIPIAGD